MPRTRSGSHCTYNRTTSPAETAIVAHRGARGAAGENTLAAFENAIKLGADMIEFDVRLTGDGRLVVHHDPDRDGLPLSGVRAAALDGRQAAPPRLAEVLDLARGRIITDVPQAALQARRTLEHALSRRTGSAAPS